MIGLQGDAKNTGSLIVNSNNEAPAHAGATHNPRLGLTYASDAILKAFDSRDRDGLTMALESFIKMCLDLKAMEKNNEKAEPQQISREDSGGWA